MNTEEAWVKTSGRQGTGYGDDEREVEPARDRDPPRRSVEILREPRAVAGKDRRVPPSLSDTYAHEVRASTAGVGNAAVIEGDGFGDALVFGKPAQRGGQPSRRALAAPHPISGRSIVAFVSVWNCSHLDQSPFAFRRAFSIAISARINSHSTGSKALFGVGSSDVSALLLRIRSRKDAPGNLPGYGSRVQFAFALT